jgi:membrane protease YdiL (CAAX protease family)
VLSLQQEGAHVAKTSADPPVRLGWAVAVVVAGLVVVNVADARVAHASLVLGPAGAAGFLALARWAGLSWQELGLGRGTWRRGLIWASGAIGAVAVVFAVGAALPLTRDAFRDARYHLGWEHALLTAFLLIPLGTVLFEEVAFRGVLWGLLRAGSRLSRSPCSPWSRRCSGLAAGLSMTCPSSRPGRSSSWCPDPAARSSSSQAQEP